MRKLFIALLISVSAFPLAAQQKVPLPFPTAVVSQLGPVPVISVPNLKCDETRALGCFSGSKRVILIDSASVGTVVGWQALHHEKCHLILWDSGQHSLMDDEDGKKEDSLCDAFGTYLAMETFVFAPRKP
jgi:hypothetical protein